MVVLYKNGTAYPKHNIECIRSPSAQFIVPVLQAPLEFTISSLQYPFRTKLRILLQLILHPDRISVLTLEQPFRQLCRVSNQALIMRLSQHKDIAHIQLQLHVAQLLAQLAYTERHITELFLREEARLSVLRFRCRTTVRDLAVRVLVAHLIRELARRVRA